MYTYIVYVHMYNQRQARFPLTYETTSPCRACLPTKKYLPACYFSAQANHYLYPNRRPKLLYIENIAGCDALFVYPSQIPSRAGFF